MPVQALLTAEPAPSQSDEGSRPVVADDPHDEARAEIASEPIVEARDVFRDDLAEPAPMPEPAVADEPADVVPIFAPAVAPALGREVVSSPAADGLPTPTVVPTPSPVVSRALSREVVFSVATTASFLFGGTLGLLVGQGAAGPPAASASIVRPDLGIYEGRDPKYRAAPPAADPRPDVAKAQGDLQEVRKAINAQEAELKKLEDGSKQRIAELDDAILEKQKTLASLETLAKGLQERLDLAKKFLDQFDANKKPSENGQDPAAGRDARPGPGPQTRTGNPVPPGRPTGPQTTNPNVRSGAAGNVHRPRP